MPFGSVRRRLAWNERDLRRERVHVLGIEHELDQEDRHDAVLSAVQPGRQRDRTERAMSTSPLRTAEYAGTSSDPYLTVTYTQPTPTRTRNEHPDKHADSNRPRRRRTRRPPPRPKSGV